MTFMLLCVIGLTIGWCERQYRWPRGSGLLLIVLIWAVAYAGWSVYALLALRG